MWRGREWKSSLTTPDKKDDILGDIDVDTALPEDGEPSVSPNQTQTMTQKSSLVSMELQNDPDDHDLSPSAVDSSAMEGTSNSLQSSSTKDVTEPTADSSLCDHEEPEHEPETSEEISKQSIERVLNLMKQAVESGTALVLDAADLDADTVFAKAVAFSTLASPGPVFQHGLRKQTTVKKQESREFGYRKLEAKPSNSVISGNASKSSNVVVSGKREVLGSVQEREEKKEGLKKKMDEFAEDYREVIPHGTLKVDELAKLLA